MHSAQPFRFRGWTVPPCHALVAILALLSLLLLSPPARGALGRGKLLAKVVASGLARPVQVTAPPGDTDRLFIVEKRDDSGTGHIRIFSKSTNMLAATPFLSLANLNPGDEEGLLGLVFHPDYAVNGYFYVYFVAEDSGVRTAFIRRYTATGPTYATAMTADAGSGFEILRFVEPHPGHNGGWMGFHPLATGGDKYYLYLGVGDGGGGNDPYGTIGNGQDKTTLLGKILRIDVGASGAADDFPGDAEVNYAIPANNPLVGAGGGVREEIWAYGLRNPWRCAWDRVTGDFWIADIGQNRREEINFQPASDFTDANPVAHNYGWRLREGTVATVPVGPIGGPPPADNVDPVFDYPHEGFPGAPPTVNGYSVDGDCVAGGVPYHGRIKWLQGRYIFADYMADELYSFKYDSATSSVTDVRLWTELDEGFAPVPDGTSFQNICSLSEGEDGEVYVCAAPGNLDAVGDGIVFVLTQAPFYLYRSTYFTAAELNASGISGTLADVDKDTLTTLEEYVLGTDPTVSEGALPYQFAVEAVGGSLEFLTIAFPKSPEAHGYVQLMPRAGDLGTMNPAAATIMINTPTLFKARSNSPVNAPWSPKKRFLDICFELLPEATEQP